MESTGLTTAQPKPVPADSKDKSNTPVNIYITATNPAQQGYPMRPSYPAAYWYYPTAYSYYPTRYYTAQYLPANVNVMPGASYNPISANNVNMNMGNMAKPNGAQQQAPAGPKPMAAASLPQTPAASPPPKDDVTPAKAITPLTNDIIGQLNESLSRGGKDERYNAIGKVLKLLREDPENRKNNPALVGLINKALNPAQPAEVKTAAIIACQDGLVANNPRTQQLLQAISTTNDRMENNTMAAAALNHMQHTT